MAETYHTELLKESSSDDGTRRCVGVWVEESTSDDANDDDR